MGRFRFCCPACGAKQSADIDLTGIEEGEIYHQSEDCEECSTPFVVGVKVRQELLVGKIEWEKMKNPARRGATGPRIEDPDPAPGASPPLPDGGD